MQHGTEFQFSARFKYYIEFDLQYGKILFAWSSPMGFKRKCVSFLIIFMSMNLP